MTCEGGTITIVPKPLADRSQASFWSAAWQSAELEAAEDIAQGHVRSFEDAQGLIAALDAEHVHPRSADQCT